jgi:hypothetical protein
VNEAFPAEQGSISQTNMVQVVVDLKRRVQTLEHARMSQSRFVWSLLGILMVIITALGKVAYDQNVKMAERLIEVDKVNGDRIAMIHTTMVERLAIHSERSSKELGDLKTALARLEEKVHPEPVRRR